MILILGKKISIENQSVRFYMYSVYLSLTFSICQQSVGVSQAINIREVQLWDVSHLSSVTVRTWPSYTEELCKLFKNKLEGMAS